MCLGTGLTLVDQSERPPTAGCQGPGTHSLPAGQSSLQRKEGRHFDGPRAGDSLYRASQLPLQHPPDPLDLKVEHLFIMLQVYTSKC